jgi:hypothetical protein
MLAHGRAQILTGRGRARIDLGTYADEHSCPIKEAEGGREEGRGGEAMIVAANVGAVPRLCVGAADWSATWGWAGIAIALGICVITTLVLTIGLRE